VPGLTLDQAADCSVVVPDSDTCRPWAKLDWLLLSSEAVPQLPLLLVREQALVVTDTVDPLVLTEIPWATAGVTARASGSAVAAAAVTPARSKR